MTRSRRNLKSSSKVSVFPPKEEIPEDEQWRLVKQTKILQGSDSTQSESPSTPDVPDEIFNTVILVIPFSFIYVMMDVLIHRQYGRHPSVADFARRLFSAVPCLSILTFYVNRYRHRRLATFGLFIASVAIGTRLIWLVNRANWLRVIRQGPALATLWIFTIAVLDLLPAVIGLVVVALWFWWKNMKLVF